ncbi:hypothetical protein DFS34DRAFT_365664 [Phlyctochytrium arcticum]|nr:hypothetical protein DFS34DRAFT_365664 [Phlyctochytrium arcticum]
MSMLRLWFLSADFNASINFFGWCSKAIDFQRNLPHHVNFLLFSFFLSTKLSPFSSLFFRYHADNLVIWLFPKFPCFLANFSCTCCFSLIFFLSVGARHQFLLWNFLYTLVLFTSSVWLFSSPFVRYHADHLIIWLI